MATQPKTNWWNTPLKDVKPLNKGLIVGLICGIIVVAILFFIFLSFQKDDPNKGIIIEETPLVQVQSGNQLITTNGANYLFEAIPLFGLESWVWALMFVGANLVIASTQRGVGVLFVIVSSIAVMLLFNDLPLWVIFIVIVSPGLFYFFNGRRRYRSWGD